MKRDPKNMIAVLKAVAPQVRPGGTSPIQFENLVKETKVLSDDVVDAIHLLVDGGFIQIEGGRDNIGDHSFVPYIVTNKGFSAIEKNCVMSYLPI